MKGIVVVNMGSPASQQEMRTFLFNMFMDPFILPYPKIFRRILAGLISSTRFKKSWHKYNLIGGSPLKQSCSAICEQLTKEIGNSVSVLPAFSYSSPYYPDVIAEMINRGITEIKVIPLYPQHAFSTSKSIETSIAKIGEKYEGINITVAGEFYQNPGFIEFWKDLISDAMDKYHLISPLLLFSAHSIPTSDVRRGDTYLTAIEKSSLLIANATGLDYCVSYQSKMKSKGWAGPDTRDLLKKISLEGISEVLIVPVSFLNENLETLYDIDLQIIPFAREVLHVNKIHRVEIPMSHPALIRLLKDLYENQ